MCKPQLAIVIGGDLSLPERDERAAADAAAAARARSIAVACRRAVDTPPRMRSQIFHRRSSRSFPGHDAMLSSPSV
jgi:hypothetical protein